ncbi:AraC family transcriptional regulator ligand-binding domain-containing protein [Brucella sp. BE17]|uniref:AraC family transcriptional regulator n=1 Tax=Brucella sp. BE17 TaxID=3142977 RepID=UPI0031BA48AD
MKAFAPYKLFALVQAAAEFGMPPEMVLSGTGLVASGLTDGKVHSTVDQYLTACSNVIRYSRDLRLPIRVGKSLHLSSYGLYGFALMCSPTVRSGFEFAVKYHGLATPVFQIAWEIREGHFVWTFPDEHRRAYTRPQRTFLMIQQLAQHVTHVKDIAHADRKPIRINVTLDTVELKSLLEQEFGCPVVFSAERTEITYEMSILDDRPPLTNPVTHAMLLEFCETLIGPVPEKCGLAGQVSRIFMESAAKFPSMEAVADSLAMSPRTLRRRLMEEDTSYSALLDQVRNKLAQRCLKANTFTVDDIAELLGFSDAANFRASFKRWNGLTPSDYRARLCCTN